MLDTVTVSQQAVAEKIVAKVGVTQNKKTPMAVGLKLEQFDADEPDMEEPFRSLVGHLMWLAIQTRPGILNAVRTVTRYSHTPKRLHWQATMHVLMYVRFTSSFGITFQREMVGGDRMELFVDFDFASKATDRRSVSGAVVMYAGACVMYLCRTQKSVALSSMEAEYVAMADGMKEAISCDISGVYISGSGCRVHSYPRGQCKRYPLGVQPGYYAEFEAHRHSSPLHPRACRTGEV